MNVYESSPFDASPHAGGGGQTMTPGVGGAVGGSDSSSGGDPNAALAELDQGLRSGRLGEQGEAIVRFPGLFAKYPFPILINSALLKLADVFRQSPNFIRLCVLRVIQQSRRHLDKVTNVDEFVKRLSTVLHSNDPAARALTLRTLGAVAAVIPERSQVHHSIRNALDSHDAVEVHAAIHAAAQFAAQSKAFSVNMCDKISRMVRGYATPLDMKIKLIPIFQHMHHDAQTAQVVRQTCVEMLPGYPAENFTCVTLHTLTLLAAHTLVDIPDQVALLLNYLYDDPRVAVKSQVLSDLRHLANEERAHLWTEENVSAVVSFAADCQSNPVLVGALAVLNHLVSNTSVDKFALTDANAPVLKLCEGLCYQTELEVASGAIQLLCSLAAGCKKDLHHVEGADLSGEAVMAVEAMFLLLNATGKPASRKILKDCLRCLVTLCRVHQEACDQFVDIAGGMLAQLDIGSETCVILCELLASLADLKPGVLKPLVPDVQQALAALCESLQMATVSERKQLHRVALLLCTLLFQTFKGHLWTDDVLSAIFNCAEEADAWCKYRLARGASRFGHHDIASKVMALAADEAASEQSYFWIRGLAKVFEGEKTVNDVANNDLVDRATEGSSLIVKGTTLIKASTSPARHQEFQTSYLKCRCFLLDTLCQLVLNCYSLRTQPPPAVASAAATSSNDDLLRCGRVTQLLRQSVKDLSAAADDYGRLYETSFDADPDTLAHLQLLQQLCRSLAQWIEMVCLKSSQQGSMFEEAMEFGPVFGAKLPEAVETYSIEVQDLLKLGEKVASVFKSFPADADPKPISNVHTDMLYRSAALLLSTPLCYPRFFFQQLQQTSLKLSVTPQPRAPGEPVGLSASQQLAVKVEGVVAGSKRLRRPWRTVEAVEVVVASSLVAPSKSQQLKLQDNAASAALSAACEQRLEQTASPHNDFFSAQFLVPFPVAGSHALSVETRLVDADGRRWSTGQGSQVNIKVFEDGQNRPPASATPKGGSRGQ